MADLKNYIVIIFSLILFACSDSWVAVYEGAQRSGNKLKIILNSSGIPARNEVSENIYTIKVPLGYSNKAGMVIDTMNFLLNDECENFSKVHKFFVPHVPGSKNDHGKYVKVAISALLKRTEIFHVTCNEVYQQADNPVKLVIWFDSLIHDHEKIDEIVKNELLSSGVINLVGYKIRDIRILMNLPVSSETDIPSRNSLIVFEPFSFHVLDDEKVSAGIQLITMLFLFLSCGGILGYWYAKRE